MLTKLEMNTQVLFVTPSVIITKYETLHPLESSINIDPKFVNNIVITIIKIFVFKRFPKAKLISMSRNIVKIICYILFKLLISTFSFGSPLIKLTFSVVYHECFSYCHDMIYYPVLPKQIYQHIKEATVKDCLVLQL